MTQRSMSVGRLTALGTPSLRDDPVTERAIGDLPVAPDRRSVLPDALSRLGLFSALIAVVTAGAVVGSGYAVSDVVILIGVQLAVALALWRLPWHNVGEEWLLVAMAAQLLFVSGLISLTGGGDSPYFALYAPVLAIAGWHLRAVQVAVVVTMMAFTETWRAIVIEGRPGLEQLIVALPAFALVAALAHLSSRRHAISQARGRLDQLRIATTLHTIRAVGDGGSGSLAAMAHAAGEVFEADAWISTPSDPSVVDGPHVCGLPGSDHAIAILRAGGAEFGWLRLCRVEPFSTTERRLVAVLAEAMGGALQIRHTEAEMRQDPRRDPVTGLLKRGSFESDLTDMLGDGASLGEPVTVHLLQLLGIRRLDADRGDLMLGRVARALRARAAETDRVYRYADDAFVVVGPGSGRHEAILVAERLRASARTAMNHAAPDGWPVLTLSVGIGEGVTGRTTAMELIATAEQSLRLG